MVAAPHGVEQGGWAALCARVLSSTRNTGTSGKRNLQGVLRRFGASTHRAQVDVVAFRAVARLTLGVASSGGSALRESAMHGHTCVASAGIPTASRSHETAASGRTRDLLRKTSTCWPALRSGRFVALGRRCRNPAAGFNIQAQKRGCLCRRRAHAGAAWRSGRQSGRCAGFPGRVSRAEDYQDVFLMRTHHGKSRA